MNEKRKVGRPPATRCKHGHEFTPENTYLYHCKRKGYTWKVCRTCRREGLKRFYARRTVQN